jgi:DNA invertase Pin-like site-specific DNA recombinase
VDDAISGAEFQNRPGYMRLLNALKPRAPFEVLIVSELSRLGREQLETGCACKQLSKAGVRIFSYLENREIALDDAKDVFLLWSMNFAAEIEREKASQRVRDAMTRKARAGHVCGGEPFGYRNRPVFTRDGRRSHVERDVHEPGAAVVRCIFDLCAAGQGRQGDRQAAQRGTGPLASAQIEPPARVGTIVCAVGAAQRRVPRREHLE